MPRRRDWKRAERHRQRTRMDPDKIIGPVIGSDQEPDKSPRPEPGVPGRKSVLPWERK